MTQCLIFLTNWNHFVAICPNFYSNPAFSTSKIGKEAKWPLMWCVENKSHKLVWSDKLDNKILKFQAYL